MENNYELIGEDKHRSPSYFVPDIEDIRVGYECEMGVVGSETDWIPYIINEDNAFHNYFLEGRGSTKLRVPYLTKEQIEAEGWKAEVQSLGHYLRAVKKCLVKQNRMGKNWDYSIPTEFQITYNTETFLLSIMYISGIDDLTWFEGECKDINTFRYICKLLKIK